MTRTNKAYDFIVIGSGIGGLVSAVLLAKEGHSVLVLEKNHQIGGSLQVFSRDKCVFDTGVHYIGSLDKGENLYQIFSYLGILNDLKMQRLDEEAYDKIILSDGTTVSHGQGYAQFKKGLLEVFPDEGDAINAFCSKIKEVCDYFPLYNLRLENERNYIDQPEILTISAWDYVASITDNQQLQAALLGNGLLYAGEREATPLYVVALITNSFLSGSYRMINGGSQIAKLLTKQLHAYGGDVLKHKEVIKAHYKNGEVSSVETADGELYEATHFIANIHPQQTINIFGEEHFRTAYRHRIAKLENTVSSFMLYLSLEKDAFPYMNYNVYAYDKPEVWETVSYDKEQWPEVMFICTSAGNNQGEYAESLSVMTYMSYDEVKQWADSFNTVAEAGERAQSYLQFKAEKEAQVIGKLEKLYPSIRNAIKGVYSSTPLTYRDYIGTDDGSLYGIKKDFNKSMMTRIEARTKIPNVYQTGQNIVFHGILGSTIGALVTCFNFIDKEDLIEKINLAE